MSLKAVRLDLFPAELMADPDAPDPADRRHVYPVRVVVTADELIVWEEHGRRPRVIFRDRLASYTPAVPVHRQTKEQRKGADRSADWGIATTDSGHALTFKSSGGCGCGSRLKVLSLQRLLELAAEDANTEPPPSQAMAVSTRDQ